MTLLIGTDEAGYGPTLGPLVIVATAWRFRDGQSVAEAFAPFEGGLATEEGERLSIGDSKKLFKPRVAGNLAELEATVAAFGAAATAEPAFGETAAGDAINGAGADGCGRIDTLARLLARLCPDDHRELRKCPWYGSLEVPFPLQPSSDRELLHRNLVRETLAKFGMEFVAMSARVIDAGPFNRLCEAAGNKASLLSEATLRLASQQIDAASAETEVHVYSDRHGGRHRYGGLLQHTRPEGVLRILQEGSPESRYELKEPQRTIDWRFTVRGDRFVPVALASMIAKYLRERLMERFNAFWQSHHSAPLLPTAGYPGDAGRFCKQIQPIASRLGIDSATYIRSR